MQDVFGDVSLVGNDNKQGTQALVDWLFGNLGPKYRKPTLLDEFKGSDGSFGEEIDTKVQSTVGNKGASLVKQSGEGAAGKLLLKANQEASKTATTINST